MATLLDRFERDCLFLSQGLVPIETTGKEVTSLDYEAKNDEQIQDEHVIKLAQSITGN